MKFTNAERLRIKLWLEKHYKSRDKAATLEFVTDSGATVELARITQYLPGGDWKIRTAYLRHTGYPVMTTGGIPAASIGKGKKPASPYKMVPKLPKQESVIPGYGPVPDSVKSNKGAFAKALDAEMASLKKSMTAQLMAPNPIWFYGIKEQKVEDGMVTFQIQDNHDKHVELHKATFNTYKKSKTKGGHIVESESHPG